MVVLTEFPGTDTAGAMAGRPPLGVKETKVRLTAAARARITALVGPNRMAEFIRDAIEEVLTRREREEATAEGRTRLAAERERGGE